METDWSVAATEEDPILVVPWHDEAGVAHYIDLQTDLTLIDQIPEARTNPDLRAALPSLNQKSSSLSTAKCDFWALSNDEKQLDFELFSSGFGAYFDVIQRNPATFSSLPAHISEARRLAAAAIQIPLKSARLEFVIRPACWHGRDGYAMTVYMYGYGATEDAARASWADAVRSAVELLTASHRAQHETLE